MIPKEQVITVLLLILSFAMGCIGACVAGG